MSRVMRVLHLLILTCILYSCTHPYSTVCVNVPQNWRVPSDDSSTTANLYWWEQFDDPVLDDLVLEALECNKDLQLAIARVEEFSAIVGVVRSQLFPQIWGTANYTRIRTSEEIAPIVPGSGASPITNLFQVALNASWELDVWGKFRNQTRAAISDLLAEEAVRRGVLVTLLSNVSSSYVRLLKFDKQLAISRRTQESRYNSFLIAKARFEGGLTSELPVKQAQAEYEAAATDTIRFEVFVEQEENLLSVLLGRSPGPIERGDLLDELKLPPCVPAGLPSELLEQRPDLMEARERLISNHYLVDASRADFFPSITLTGAYGNESIELKNLFTGPTRSWNYAVNFMQPIFTGGRLISQLRVRQAREMEALFNYERAILVAFREVDDALIAHEKSKELLKEQKILVEVSQEYVNLARLQYRNGETDYLSVLDAERRLFLAELDFAEIQSNSFLTLIELYRALGGGWGPCL